MTTTVLVREIPPQDYMPSVGDIVQYMHPNPKQRYIVLVTYAKGDHFDGVVVQSSWENLSLGKHDKFGGPGFQKFKGTITLDSR